MNDPRALFAALAVPRLAGSPGHARVRERLATELTRRGFDVARHEFTTGPGALAAAQVCGAALGAAVCGTWLLARLPNGAPAFWWTLVALVGIVLYARAHAGPAASAAGRIAATNLIARRPGAPPAVWLAAHFDSKGQRLSMAGRLAAVGLCVFGAAALLVFAVWRAMAGWDPVAAVLLVPGLVGGLLLARCRTTDASPGAVDNATALLAVLEIVDALPRGAHVGVLFLDAEEFGLQGSHALLRDRPEELRGAFVINFDGLDDRGRTRVLAHRPGPRGSALAARLGARPARRLPVLVDGIVLAAGAAECVTVMRGDWATTRVVHTPR
ncbi:MAG TPA: M28 family peptidase, partial [Gemmatimonadales bacterium]